MQSAPTTVTLLRKVLFLALIGFLVVILAGPIVAVLSVLLSIGLVVLSFALVGFIVWGVFLLLVHGKQAAWTGIRDLGHLVGVTLGGLGRAAGSVLAFAPRVVRGVWAQAGPVARGAWRGTRTTGRVALDLAVATVAGVFIGAVVGGVVGTLNHDLDGAVAMNAFFGGVIAFVAGSALMIRERRGLRRTSQPAA